MALDTSLYFIRPDVAAIIRSTTESDQLIGRIIQGIPASLAPALRNGTFTLQHLLGSDLMTQQTKGAGLYGILYKMPGNERDCLYVGSTNDFGRRCKEHEDLINDPDALGMSSTLHKSIFTDPL